MRPLAVATIATALAVATATAGCANSSGPAASASAEDRSTPATNAATPARRTAATPARPASTSAEPALAPVASVSVDQLDELLAHNDCQAVDTNGDPTRKRLGVIPGAVLLTDYENLDKLPPDKSTHLVFYCANSACRSSDEAAERAIAAGYHHVQVLPAGIAGWIKAGKKTTPL
jgi:rhodanese-related sulfurtransferase